jgi:hypothetical protein
MKLVVSACWICCTAPKRDRMSPGWRFSNQAIGSRSRWVKTLSSHWRFNDADNASTAHERAAAVAVWISTSSPKPMPSVISRSRLALTSTSSTTHCMKYGDRSTKA